jgi:hypothetical protein
MRSNRLAGILATLVLCGASGACGGSATSPSTGAPAGSVVAPVGSAAAGPSGVGAGSAGGPAVATSSPTGGEIPGPATVDTPAPTAVETPPLTPSAPPSAFAIDPVHAADLAVSGTGGGVAVTTGTAIAAVYVPAGSAPAGTTWKVLPLSAAPAGVRKPLSPGIYVDTAGTEPTAECLIAFALPGKVSADATIVRIADDGATTTVVATTRVERNGRTELSAAVDGFSAYTTAEEDAKARDQAAVEAAKKRGKQSDWTIKASGTETQHNQGWTFNYEFDFFASGGGVGQGGLYKGHASLSIEGKYKGPVSIVKSFGKLSAIGRDQAMTFALEAPELASLIDGSPVDASGAGGKGTMKMKGMGSLDITATGPTVKGSYNKNAKATSNVPFTIVIRGDAVQVEIPKVGIFGGLILRTSK